jgi:hypothetical protein
MAASGVAKLRPVSAAWLAGAERPGNATNRLAAKRKLHPSAAATVVLLEICVVSQSRFLIEFLFIVVLLLLRLLDHHHRLRLHDWMHRGSWMTGCCSRHHSG